MRIIARSLLAAALTIPATSVAQTGGTISGVVRDTLGHPVPEATVMFLPGSKRTTTDSSGHFAASNLEPDYYHVRVRRIGFVPDEITTDLAKNGRIDLKFELKQRPAILDSVIVRADGKCPELGFTGFNCRRRGGKGVYLTDDDILDRGAIDLGDIFRDLDGFRVEMAVTSMGAKPRPL